MLLGRDGAGNLTIASVVLFIGLCSACLAIVLDSLYRSPLRAVAGVTVWCILGFGIGYLPYLYLWHAYASQPLSTFRVSFPRRVTTGADAVTLEVREVTRITSGHVQTLLSPEKHAPVPPCGLAAVSDAEALALRAAPGLKTARIGSRPRGTTVELVCDAPVKADGVSWRKVRTDGIEGWMNSRFLR